MATKYVVDGQAFAKVDTDSLEGQRAVINTTRSVDTLEEAKAAALASTASPELSTPYKCCGGKLGHLYGCLEYYF